MNVDIVSVEIDEQDIVSHILHGVEEHLSKSMLYKITKIVGYFIEGKCIPDGRNFKNLEWQIYEFRIQIPWRNELLRIIFYCDRHKIVLLTWYFIKPEQYQDKQNKTLYDKIYQEEIKKAKYILQDYLFEKKLSYQNISYLFSF